MERPDLFALVEDIGKGNVLHSEMLEGCSVAAHELDEMDADMAASVAAHIFQELYDYKVEYSQGKQADPDGGVWSGSVEKFKFCINRDDNGDLIIDFFVLSPDA
ncbi:hypothetical protein [Synechococcus sp. M16CYN]|uniref:hypothetical protein n=1 Tax=Synechococcus sp. M16CYN TaxID=3103139 RepID=UPI0032473E29